jgi:superfamily II DNA or RNA helicase
MMDDWPSSEMPVSIDELLNDLDRHLRRDAEDALPGASRHKVEYVFAVDCPATRDSGALVVRLMARSRRADGTWDRPMPAAAGPDDALAVGATDRRLLVPLLGAGINDAKPAEQSRADGALRFVLPGALALEWVPLAARAGRLILREDAASTSTRALQWDDGPPWRFTLEVDDADDGYVLYGVLTRLKDRLNVSDPVLLLDVGLLFTHERVATFDPGPSFGVLSMMREKGAATIPAAQSARLAEILHRFGVAPESIPPALALRPVSVAPSARLHFWPASPDVLDPGSGDVEIDATLSFDYDGTQVPAKHGDTFFDADRQRIIHPDAEAESEAQEILLELGAVRANVDDPGAWRIEAKVLDATVRALVADGWKVEASGISYKTAGPARLKVISGIDWFDLTAVVPFGNTSAPLVELLASLRRGEKTIQLGDGSVGILPEEWLRRYAPLVAAGIENDDGTIRYRASQGALVDALLEAQAETAEIQVDEAFLRLKERLATFDRAEAIDPPASFTGVLRSYQREGLGWIQFLRHFGFGGCLADDMGLGKTVTVLAELARVSEARQQVPAETRGPRPSLVVVPRSVVHNWKDEASKFTPQLRVLDYSAVDRRLVQDDISEYDIVLVTYGTVRRDIEQLKDVEFEYVILDEAQMIKNAATVAAKAVRLLKSRHRLALSGTPIENHLGELWSIFEFLNPGLLGRSAIFQRAASANPDSETVSVVARGLKPFLLRRTKAQVATELPARTEQTLTCVLTPRERGFYDALRRHYRSSLLAHVSKMGMAQSGLQILEALLRLRQAACHPGLVSPARQSDPSSKIELLLENLQAVINEGHKALVFSQFTSLLSLVRPVLTKARLPFEYLDGRTRDRSTPVARFQEDPNCPIFLVSLKAGGVGLNLTAADYVFLLDPWWNPAVEAQAIDRTHRIGQTKEVFAYRLIAEDTVEEKVLALQQHKKALAEAVLSANPVGLRGLSKDDLDLLLS